jgi:hypothetical protein
MANTRCLKKAVHAFLFYGPAKFVVSSFVRCEERVPDRRRAFVIDYFKDPTLVAA